MTKICMYEHVIDSGTMGRLPDNLWRLAIELTILSTEYEPLPSFDDLAWLLHYNEDRLNTMLEQLLERDIVDFDQNNQLVLNYLLDAAYDLKIAKESLENAIS